jgi:cell division protein FtsZ
LLDYSLSSGKNSPQENRIMGFNFDSIVFDDAQIKIVGVGKTGISAINHAMLTTRLKGAKGVEFITVSTPFADLSADEATKHIVLEEQSSGWPDQPEATIADPTRCEGDYQKIFNAIGKADMVIVVTGAGCAITTAGALFVAEIARKLEILTIGLVAFPFAFEGQSRAKTASAGIEAMKQRTDSTVVVQGDKLVCKELAGDQSLSVSEASRKVDEALVKALVAMTAIIVWPGEICTDFSDVKTILCDGGLAAFSWGESAAENRAEKAVEMAISSPLLCGYDLKKCKGLLILITCNDHAVSEVQHIIDFLQKVAGEDVNIIFGDTVADFSEKEPPNGLLRVSIIATGFQHL